MSSGSLPIGPGDSENAHREVLGVKHYGLGKAPVEDLPRWAGMTITRPEILSARIRYTDWYLTPEDLHGEEIHPIGDSNSDEHQGNDVHAGLMSELS
jgi:hypothetical protein